MDVRHLFSLPLHVNPNRLDPCMNLNFIAVPISRNIIGIWKNKEINSLLNSEKKAPTLAIELAGHNQEILALSFTCSSKFSLASACCDKIILWDLSQFDSDSQPTQSIFFNKPGDINVMCFNNSDKLIAAGRNSNIILLPKSKSVIKASLEAHSTFISGLKFCPHYSATLVSISDDRTFCVWDVDKLVLLYQSSIITSTPLISMDMNFYEPHVAIGSADGILRVFDLTSDHGFRQLANLDVANLLKKRKAKENTEESSSNSTITISKTSKKTKSQINDAVNDIGACVEASESLLHIEYTYDSTSQFDESCMFPDLNGQYSAAGDLVKDVPASLNIISSNHWLHLNSRTFEVLESISLQNSMKSVSFSSSTVIGPLSYAAVKQINACQILAVTGALFESKVNILGGTLITDSLRNSQTINPSRQSHDSINFEEECSLSIVAVESVFDNSPLKSELLPPVSKTVITKGDIAIGKKKSASPMNQPLTFKSKIKSSGYTQAPRTSMFKPETNKHKLLGMEAPKKKPSKINSGAMKMLTNEYDVSKGPVNEQCDLFQVDSATCAVLNLRFSDDGSNIACALSNKTALAVKSPFSKRICTSFIGHNSQVNSVYWSSSNEYLLTSSNDKTVAIWNKTGGDPVMVINNKNGSVKEIDRRNSTSNNGATMKSTSKSLGSSSNSSGSAVTSKPFIKDIKHSQFFYMDKFILLVHGSELSLFKYYISPEVDDLKRYQSRNRFKLVDTWESESSTFTSMAAVNKFYSHLVLGTTSGKTIEVYDINKSLRCHVFTDVHTRPPHSIVINEGSGFSTQSSLALNVFATAAPTDSIKLWDIRSKSCIQALTGHLNNSQACQIAFSPCGNYLASGSEDRCAYIFDLRKGTFCEKLRGHNEVVCSVAFHPAYPLLATGSLDSRIVWYKSV